MNANASPASPVQDDPSHQDVDLILDDVKTLHSLGYAQEEEVRSYLVYLVRERRSSWSHYNVTVCALRFLYRVTLDKDWPVKHVPYAKRPKKLPSVLSRDEVVRLLAHIEYPAHRIVLMTIYATGLRVSQATRLRAGDLPLEELRGPGQDPNDDALGLGVPPPVLIARVAARIHAYSALWVSRQPASTIPAGALSTSAEGDQFTGG